MSNAVVDPNPELIGKRIGRLIVVEYAGCFAVGSQKVHKWRCLCDCGKQTNVVKQRLMDSSVTRSCGCFRGESIRRVSMDRAGHPANNLIGRRVGKLTVLRFVGICPRSINLPRCHYLWECQCECGNTIDVRAISLTRTIRPRRSCGNCKPKPTKPAATRTQLTGPRSPIARKLHSLPLQPASISAMREALNSDLASWLRSEYDNIYGRCNDENHKYYYLFGGSGITLVWDNPECFAEWVMKNLGSKPVGTKILRIDRYGNFEPNNLKWATL